MKLIDMVVTDYLNIVASDAPAPGGGSAAAFCGAQGTGLVTMVAGQTAVKKSYEADWPLCHEIIEQGKKIYDELTAQVDRDTDAYNLVAAAFKMPKATDEEKAVRRKAIADATLVATEVPFETLRLSVAALELADKMLGHYNTNCASDLGVGGLNLHTCVHGYLRYRLFPEEVLTAVTLNAACAIGKGDSVGSIEPGKLADIVLWNADELPMLCYRMGSNQVKKVIKRGRVAVK